ncbi:hypothetical protein [Corallibacter sp.]|uniref:hypothetical protein n=1 Tax=Corallibacter sp. TaxID=2038084 RepID=UPI003A941DE8
MKSYHFLFIALLLCIFSCKEEKKQPEINTEVKTESTQQNAAPVSKDIYSNTRSISASENSLYNNNLQIIDGKTESNYDNTSKTITLEIPVSNANFSFYKKFDISSSTKSAILYVVTDNTDSPILSNTKTHIIEDTFSMTNFLDGNQVKNNKLYVFTFNDAPKDFDKNEKTIVKYYTDLVANGSFSSIACIQTKSLLPEPKEQCGGIIVGN